MKKYGFKIGMVVGFLIFANTGFAQDSSMPKINALDDVNAITNLDQALYYSYVNNAGLRAERADLRATQEEYPQALANFLPSLTWNASIDAVNLRGDNINSTSDGESTKEYGFSLSQPLFRGGRSFAEVDEATNNIYAAQAGLNQEEQSVFLDVVEAYMNLIRDRRALDIQIRNETVLQNRLNNSEALYRAGELTRADVSQSRARLSNAQSERLDAEIDLNAARESFINLVGIQPSEELFFPVLNLSLPQSLQEAQDLALNNNPEIIEARFEHLAAVSSIDVEYRALMPQISLTAEIKNQLDPGPGTNERRNEQNIGVSMSIPFFQGGAQRSEVREAKITANQRKLELMQQIRDVMEEVSDSWREYQSSIRKIELREVQVEAAQEARDGVKREVDAGERTYVDLLDADQDLLDAELSLILAERNAILEAYNLLALVGGMNANVLNLNPKSQVYTDSENLKRIKKPGGFLSMDVYEDDPDPEPPRTLRLRGTKPDLQDKPEAEPDTKTNPYFHQASFTSAQEMENEIVQKLLKTKPLAPSFVDHKPVAATIQPQPLPVKKPARFKPVQKQPAQKPKLEQPPQKPDPFDKEVEEFFEEIFPSQETGPAMRDARDIQPYQEVRPVLHYMDVNGRFYGRVEPAVGH